MIQKCSVSFIESYFAHHINSHQSRYINVQSLVKTSVKRNIEYCENSSPIFIPYNADITFVYHFKGKELHEGTRFTS